MFMSENKKYSYEQTLKSMDTEEFLDLKFYRPLGYCWALFFEKLKISPNTVSVLSIILGVSAGVMFYFNDLILNVIGMFLLVWANTYDSADGQLARMTGQFSYIGRILDGACGDLWFITIYASICIRLTPEWGIWIWILAATAGFCHAKQAAIADYYRNFHLFFIKGKKGSELDDSNKVKKELEALKFSKDPVYKVFTWFYLNYTKNQEIMTPQMQKFRKTLRAQYGDNDVPETLREEFRKKSLPLMKYTNMLSFNTRVIALFVSLFLSQPWLYFVFELTVIKGMLIDLLITPEKICKEFNDQISN